MHVLAALEGMGADPFAAAQDLDFTARTPWDCEALLEELKHAVSHMEARLAHFGPFQVAIMQERHRGPHPRGQCSFRVRAQFPWMRSPDCSLKIEVAAQEPLLTEPVERPILHEFPGESIDASVLAYSLEEIGAEKLRALLQSRQHAEDHGWVRNRPRDLYDLWHLWRQRDVPIDWDKIRDILQAKAEAYGITYKGPEDFLDKQVLEGIQRDWEGQLRNFVVDLPPFAECRQALEAILARVFPQQEG